MAHAAADTSWNVVTCRLCDDRHGFPLQDFLEMEDWITPQECRHRLRVGRTKIYELLADGQIPGAVKLGNAWRIHLPTLLASWACQPLGSKEKVP